MSLLDYEFGLEYDVMLSAWGKGILSENSLLDFQKPEEILRKYQKEYRRKPKSISLYVQDPTAVGYDYGFTEVDSEFLEKLQALKELILPPSVTELRMTPRLERIFADQNTLIRGAFNSFAESFARDNKLRFRHADFVFAEYESEHPPESTRLTMQFRRDGSAVIKEDVRSSGTSASNTLGGVFWYKLNKDFYRTQTVEEIADLFRGDLRDAVLKDGRLAEFLTKAKTHDLFTGHNR